MKLLHIKGIGGDTGAMHRSKFRAIAALTVMSVFALLGACTTLSEDSCEAGDWFSIGVADGAVGRTADFVTKHAEACARYGIRPNQSQWEDGRQRGHVVDSRPPQDLQELPVEQRQSARGSKDLLEAGPVGAAP